MAILSHAFMHRSQLQTPQRGLGLLGIWCILALKFHI